ncbi:UDP-N-acetylglucosamine 1-carboxyvinyltransferase [Prevotella sp. E15-22]|uniref:UDP-N-acetylglucosamine 1-carboxyvinyltransferase n=1 Tax=Prevotella sp. E15-22 TaxID=2937774 RepID=UPI002056DA47|nr:UDP-N-acetylglucosamine 1-carboxyvinyltransferase [Prevotella sp. E15-22]UPS44073.1 UDP-N-acetylglucosamine 1-carboxyvinyltransferase [Prevotella sp. E15-22]
MAAFIIEGGHPLSGTIVPQGAKNEALQVICATLLTSDKVTIHNIPQIRDVMNLIQLLKDVGVKVTEDSRNTEDCGVSGLTCTFQADELNLDYLQSNEFVQKCAQLRGSVMMIGPLLARMGKATIAKPGGDKIGRRRLDTHFLGFERLGAQFHHVAERDVYEIHAQQLNGCYMLLDEASVTGTANIVMAAVMAKGTTTIYNAACEPYLQQLCKMLNKMGARISGIASNLLTIEGVDHLNGTDHTILPDMIEVGSFIGMAAMVGNGIRIKNVSIKDLGIIPNTFRRMGITIKEEGDDLYIPHMPHYEIQSFIDGTIMTLADAPWPGLTPDLLSVLITVATQARGSVLVHQKMFESRLFFVDKLIDMGAQIILCDPHRAVVVGHDRKLQLRGGRMSSPDIRAGIALLIAAMSAKGTSRIDNIEQIDRGYENIEARLNALGAKIERIS